VLSQDFMQRVTVLKRTAILIPNDSSAAVTNFVLKMNTFLPSMWYFGWSGDFTKFLTVDPSPVVLPEDVGCGKQPNGVNGWYVVRTDVVCGKTVWNKSYARSVDPQKGVIPLSAWFRRGFLPDIKKYVLQGVRPLTVCTGYVQKRVPHPIPLLMLVKIEDNPWKPQLLPDTSVDMMAEIHEDAGRLALTVHRPKGAFPSFYLYGNPLKPHDLNTWQPPDRLKSATKAMIDEVVGEIYDLVNPAKVKQSKAKLDPNRMAELLAIYKRYTGKSKPGFME